MNEQSLQLYKKAKRLNLKSLGVMAVTLIVLVILVSVFAGWPFPYRDEIFGVPYWFDGWILDKVYLWLLVCLITLIISVTWKTKQVIKTFRPYMSILNDQCDAQALLEVTQSIRDDFRGKPGTAARIIRNNMESMYITSLNALERFEELLEYLNTSCKLKKRIRNVYYWSAKCNMASLAGNKEEYLECCNKLPKRIKKTPQWYAQKLRVEGDYEGALKLLKTVKGNNLYERVAIAAASASCYMALGKIEEAQEHIDFVIEHGNTLGVKDRILKYRSTNYEE